MDGKESLINYDEISKIYDDIREGDLITAQYIIQESGVSSNSRILEVGCGTGNYAVLLSKLTNAHICGLDQSEGMLQKAKGKSPALNLLQGDAVTLCAIANDEFNLVYMVDVIHHIKDIDTMFKNIYRIMKNNSYVMIFTDSHEHIKSRLTTKYFPETLEAELNRYQSTEQIIQSMKKNGFSNIKADTLVIGDDRNFGQKLIEIAKNKGYSMFNLISQEAIDRGIERIKRDLNEGDIVYHMRAPYIIGKKIL